MRRGRLGAYATDTWLQWQCYRGRCPSMIAGCVCPVIDIDGYPTKISNCVFSRCAVLFLSTRQICMSRNGNATKTMWLNARNGIVRGRYMATFNYCSGCKKNFAGVTSFDRHRTGTFGQGWEKGTRRCLTSDEMQEKGWTMAVEPVKRRLNNTPYVEQMETWHQPVSEKAQARFTALNAARHEKAIAR